MPLIFKNIQIILKSLRYFSLLKISNFLRLIFSYVLSAAGIKTTKIVLPTFISIEITNYCNLHCPECTVGKSEYSTDKKRNFNFVLFKNLIEQLKPTLTHIIFYFQGEPFLNNRLTEFVEFAHKSNIFTSTSTNGQYLTKKIANEIVISGLDKIIVSVDGATQEVYEKYRVGGSLNKAIEGINELVNAKKEQKSSTPFIEVQFLVLKTNEHQMSDMKRLSKSLHVNKLTFKTAQLYDFEKGNDLMPVTKKYSRYKKRNDGKFYLKGNQLNRCWRMYSGAVINVNGEVLPCCFDKGSDYSFGNINEKLFTDCWHSKKASDFRDGILQNRKQYEMCRNCTSN
ncbi:MAG: radical SAM protein [Paludibacter sp.]|nr:radical SAM protein [Paludibacter sp.]